MNGASGAAISVIPAEPTAFDGSFEWQNLWLITCSNDGRMLAYGRRLCEVRGLTCEQAQTERIVFDVETGATSIAAVIGHEIGSIVFSPDRRRIAYAAQAGGAYSTLYVADVP